MTQIIKNILGNLTSMLLALVLAVMIWVAAVRASNPLETKDFQLNVRTIKQPDAVIMNTPVNQVQIRVEAPKNTLDTLKATDFDLFIDLNGAGFGRTELPVQVAYPSDIELDPSKIQIFPSTIEVELDQLVTVELPVRVKIQGNPAEAHAVGGSSADPDKVSVTGPATRINVLKEAKATVFLDNTRETRVVTRPLVFYDQQDNAVTLNSDKIDISDTQATVTVDIQEREGFADVSIRVRWKGRIAPGYRFLAAVPNPRTVTVQGPPDVVKTLRSIPTEEIDLTGLNTSDIFRVALDLPENITVQETTPIVVEVEIEQIMTTDVFVATPTVIGLGEELSATVAITQVNVVLFGPLETLNTIENDDVRVDIPLFGFTEGEYNVEPVVSPPPLDGIEVRSFQPDLITVVISSTITETISDTENITPTEGAAEGYYFRTVPQEKFTTIPDVPVSFAILPHRYGRRLV
ncbi:MAG TPA: hypothetical protein ENJ56_01125 [Anaerolineae bacterium]|nr:hypothetical protein [Anaerolineae bacterium]